MSHIANITHVLVNKKNDAKGSYFESFLNTTQRQCQDLVLFSLSEEEYEKLQVSFTQTTTNRFKWFHDIVREKCSQFLILERSKKSWNKSIGRYTYTFYYKCFKKKKLSTKENKNNDTPTATSGNPFLDRNSKNDNNNRKRKTYTKATTDCGFSLTIKVFEGVKTVILVDFNETHTGHDDKCLELQAQTPTNVDITSLIKVYAQTFKLANKKIYTIIKNDMRIPSTVRDKLKETTVNSIADKARQEVKGVIIDDAVERIFARGLIDNERISMFYIRVRI